MLLIYVEDFSKAFDNLMIETLKVLLIDKVVHRTAFLSQYYKKEERSRQKDL